MPYDAVLFDFDGVLVEMPSSKTMYDAVCRTYEKLGRSRPSEETVRRLVSGNFDAIADQCRKLGVDANRFCTQAGREMIRAQREEVERGVRSVYDDVAAVRTLERPLGIVSDNHPTVVSMLTERFGVRSLFETVHGCPLTPDGLERRKPNAGNIEAAMDELGAETALYVGDRSIDVEAAHNAGIDSAFLSRDGDEPDVAPTYRLTSLSQLSSIVE